MLKKSIYSKVQPLRFFALLEGSSLLILLLIAVPIKYHFGYPQAVQVIGPVHGGLFVLFNLILMGYLSRGTLNAGQAALGFLASLIPFGSFVYKAKVLNKL